MERFERMITAGYNPLSFSDGITFTDKEKYQKYCESKNGEGLSNDIDTDILKILNDLGFPMEKKGTYLYKELISEVYDRIQKGEDEKELLLCLKDKCSNIYTEVSQEWLEMPQLAFLNSVEDSINNIKYKNSDKVLFRKLCKSINPSKDYGVLAFKIAKYYQLLQKENRKTVIGRFSATSFEDKDIHFLVYSDNTIGCQALDKKNIERIVIKPRFELISDGNIYTYGSPYEGKSEPYFGLIKEYNIEEDLFDYLKSHGMIMYSTEMAYLYDFKDKKGYDAKEKNRAFKWTDKTKIMKKQKEGRFNY